MKADFKMSKESNQGSLRGSGADVHSSSHPQLSLLGSGAYRDTGVGVMTNTAHWYNPLSQKPTFALSFPVARWVAGLGFKAAKTPKKNKRKKLPAFPFIFLPPSSYGLEYPSGCLGQMSWLCLLPSPCAPPGPSLVGWGERQNRSWLCVTPAHQYLKHPWVINIVSSTNQKK